MVRRMMILVTVALVTAAMMTATALPAFAVGENPPTSCGTGGVFSAATQSEFNEFGNGIGKNLLGTYSANPGEFFQDYRSFAVEPVCHQDDPGQTA